VLFRVIRVIRGSVLLVAPPPTIAAEKSNHETHESHETTQKRADWMKQIKEKMSQFYLRHLCHCG